MVRYTESLKQSSFYLERISKAFRTAARFLMNRQYPPQYILYEIDSLSKRMIEMGEKAVKLDEEIALFEIKLLEEYGEGF